jgi:hypothetical protein
MINPDTQHELPRRIRATPRSASGGDRGGLNQSGIEWMFRHGFSADMYLESFELVSRIPSAIRHPSVTESVEFSNVLVNINQEDPP